MDLEQHILAVVEPELSPTEITFEDFNEEDGGDRQSKTIGAVAPVVQVNGFQFTGEMIERVNLNLSDVLPSVKLVLNDTTQAFGLEFMPRDGDVITLLINSKNTDTFKTIHMDFEITSISLSTDEEDGSPEINISGNAKIPKYFAETCRNFEAGTSLDHLELIARDLKIGLATNIETTDDSMPRVQPYIPTFQFIEDIVDNSYIAENSFQRYHIDQFYYLNFVDVNKVFNSENSSIETLQESLTTFVTSIAEEGNNATEEGADNIPSKLILTNAKDAQGTNMFIKEHKLKNNSNRVSQENGYTRNIMYYDDNNPDVKLTELTVAAQVSENLADIDEPLRGRRGETEFEEQVKFKYMGRHNTGEDGLGNVHANALFSELNNYQNNAELDKMKVIIKLESFNPSLYKYQKVPLLIYNYEREVVEIAKELKTAKESKGLNESPIAGANDNPITNEETPDQMLDTFLSGHYVIENINIIYDIEEGLTQHVTLLRREWPTRISNIEGKFNRAE